MLSDEQKDAIDGIFQDIAHDVTRGNGCYNQLDDMNDLVSGMLGDVRNATLEEVANYISSAWLNAKSNIEIAKIVRQMKESS